MVGKCGSRKAVIVKKKKKSAVKWIKKNNDFIEAKRKCAQGRREKG